MSIQLDLGSLGRGFDDSEIDGAYRFMTCGLSQVLKDLLADEENGLSLSMGEKEIRILGRFTNRSVSSLHTIGTIVNAVHVGEGDEYSYLVTMRHSPKIRYCGKALVDLIRNNIC